MIDVIDLSDLPGEGAYLVVLESLAGERIVHIRFPDQTAASVRAVQLYPLLATLEARAVETWNADQRLSRMEAPRG